MILAGNLHSAETGPQPRVNQGEKESDFTTRRGTDRAMDPCRQRGAPDRGRMEDAMSDGMGTAVVVTNVLLGLMTLGVVVACVAGGCASLFRYRKEAIAHDAHPPKVV